MNTTQDSKHKRPFRLFVSALEYSSNLHLQELKKALDSKKLDYEMIGIFDKDLVIGGGSLESERIFNPKVFRVMGFLGVFSVVFAFFKVQKQLVELAKDSDFILLMDSSSFNLPLAKKIRSVANVPISYYILPQIWAWKPWRVKSLQTYCDNLWGILPFEKHFYTEKFEYVGHPLLDKIKTHRTTQIHTQKIAFLPGSRKAEIQMLLPTFKEVAQHLKGQNKQAVLVIPAYFRGTDIQNLYGDLSAFELCYGMGNRFLECEFAFVCSGTATLETALMGIPTILVYKAKTLDYLIAKSLVKLDYIGLANLILQKGQKPIIMPEILQDEVKSEVLLREYNNYNYERFFQSLEQLYGLLEHGSAKEVAQRIQDFS